MEYGKLPMAIVQTRHVFFPVLKISRYYICLILELLQLVKIEIFTTFCSQVKKAFLTATKENDRDIT